MFKVAVRDENTAAFETQVELAIKEFMNREVHVTQVPVVDEVFNEEVELFIVELKEGVFDEDLGFGRIHRAMVESMVVHEFGEGIYHYGQVKMTPSSVLIVLTIV